MCSKDGSGNVCFILVVFFVAFAASISVAQERDDLIRTPGRVIDTSSMKSVQGKLDGGLYIVRFASEPSDELLEALSRRGFALREYIERNTYWLQAPGGSGLSDIGDVEFLVKADAADKISPSLSEILEARAGGDLKVTVQFFDDCDPAAISSFVGKLGISKREATLLFGKRMHLTLTREQLNELAKSDMVNVIEAGPRPKKLMNLNTGELLGVDSAKDDYRLNGNGVTVGIWDGGAVFGHKEYSGRLTIAEPGAVSEHATHVAGTIGAKGKNKNAEGMAPASELVSFDFYGDIPTEMANARKNYLIDVSSNSWGYTAGWEYIYLNDYYGYVWCWFGKTNFGRYTSEAAAYDKLIYQKDFNILFAAGNHRGDDFVDVLYYDVNSGTIHFGLVWGQDGPYNTIDSNAAAKNVISVGATKGAKQMSSFSSWGPTKDGRVKPEITAPGVNTYSTLPGGKYGSKSGTSMATPAVSGSIALLIQQWKGIHGKAPSPAVLRSIMAITAKDYGAKGPDYKYGFGVLDVATASEFIAYTADYNLVVENKLKKKKRTHYYTVTVSSKKYPLKVCVAWTDPPGQPDATTALVNDIDIKLRDPNGKQYYPYVLNKNNPGKKATTGVNSVDNIELIYVKKPKEGEWQLEVSIGNFGKGTRQEYVLSVY